MRANQIEAELEGRVDTNGFLQPDYGRYCFGRVPATAASLLDVSLGESLPKGSVRGIGEGAVDRVVVLLVDGFGYDRWLDTSEAYLLFRRLKERGTVTPLTSVFPSETAAAITSVHTGVDPASHGVLGWSMYLPSVGDVIEPLPFGVLGGDSGSATDVVSPDDVVCADPIYPALAERDVESVTIQPKWTIDTPYARRSLSGSDAVPYEDLEEMADNIRTALEETTSRRYIYAHVPDVDLTAHEFGTMSEAYRDKLETIERTLRRRVLDRIDPDVAARTVLFLTADHGQVDTRPESNLNLLADDAVRSALLRDDAGDPIPPVGGPRNTHLHLREGRVDAVRSHLRETTDAIVWPKEQVLDKELFGRTTRTETVRRRCGDLVVLHPQLSVWYDDGVELDRIGQHGGLRPREMVVPLSVARLSQLR